MDRQEAVVCAAAFPRAGAGMRSPPASKLSQTVSGRKPPSRRRRLAGSFDSGQQPLTPALQDFDNRLKPRLSIGKIPAPASLNWLAAEFSHTSSGLRQAFRPSRARIPFQREAPTDPQAGAAAGGCSSLRSVILSPFNRKSFNESFQLFAG